MAAFKFPRLYSLFQSTLLVSPQNRSKDCYEELKFIVAWQQKDLCIGLKICGETAGL